MPMNRRKMLKRSAAVAIAAVLGAGRRAAAAPRAEIHETKVISQQQNLYHGWPTLARRRNGQLLLVCSGGREAHVCPFGRVELMRSDDEGRTWSWPRVLMDSAIDDRDAGVLETAQGSILVTTFTSLAYESILSRAEQIAPGSGGAWPEDRLQRWQAAHRRISAEARQRELGVWMIRSTDGGVTFSARYDCLVDSPHGPIQLADRRLLYAGKDLWREKHRVGFCESADDGQTWRWLAELPVRDGDSHENYHELHAVETADERLIAQIRNHNQANHLETLQSESSDGGRTWSVPHPIGVWGLPSHLLRLRDDRLLMTYGHRREPLGNQARISSDHGRTWSDPIILSDDGFSGDLGYPSTVQLADGSLLSVWYERMKDSPNAVLRQARWSTPSI
ncbi:MAG TPA: sialidase family protein [Thermoguttaceae bacterium]|nr:sialidase family protein [Thermoguttaceae bacterium]